MELRQVFFGEETDSNYVALCHPEDATYPISSVFQDAYNDGSAPAEFRVVDCKHVLSSGKTVFERFKLDEKKRPTVFVSGKMGPPKQVPTKHLKTGSMLVKALKNLLVPKAEKIETTQDLRSKCLDKDICGLLLKGGKQSPNYVKDAMSKLLTEFPKVTFGAIDTSVLYVKGLEAEFLNEMVTGQPRFVVFEKVVDPKAKDRLKTSVATLPGGNGVAYGPMSNLVGSVVQKTATMQKVTTLPTIKTRTKKLEEEERAKRQRRIDQQKRQNSDSDSGTSTPGGYFTENDGSKEGRKAERERRRAEHRKNNPNYKEKTPEEIAEMERQRRKRMEEEAEKWNMSPEDEAGGDGSGGGGDYFETEDVYDDSGDDDEENDDDEEDILDLD